MNENYNYIKLKCNIKTRLIYYNMKKTILQNKPKVIKCRQQPLKIYRKSKP